MIKDIIKYPQTPSIQFNAPVRFFNEELYSLIQDLKDTIEANSLQALSAYEIGNQYSVIVLKQDNGSYIEMMNARIFSSNGKITTEETTPYFGDISATITRDKNIKIMYEDRDDKQCFYKASDELAVLLQQMIDYNFGANFRVRLNEQEQETFDNKLEYGNDAIINNQSCPTTFHRDKVLKLINIMLILSVIAVFSKFFVADIVALESNINSGMMAIFGTIIFYIFFAYYEGQKYTSCMSCQIGNILGTAGLYSVRLVLVWLLKLIII
jgi:peptide deformylase